MSDLFGNHIVGFPTRWLICHREVTIHSVVMITVFSIAVYAMKTNAEVCLFRMNRISSCVDAKYNFSRWLPTHALGI